MLLDNVDRDSPEMRAPRGRIVGVHRSHKPGERLFPAEQHHPAENRNNQGQRQPGLNCSALEAWCFSLRLMLLVVMTPETHRSRQEKDFSHKGDDATTRVSHD